MADIYKPDPDIGSYDLSFDAADREFPWGELSGKRVRLSLGMLETASGEISDRKTVPITIPRGLDADQEKRYVWAAMREYIHDTGWRHYAEDNDLDPVEDYPDGGDAEYFGMPGYVTVLFGATA